MKLILFGISLFCTLLISAQPCAIKLYTDKGEKFKLYTNGVLRNDQSTNEIEVCGFPSDIVKVKLEFEDSTTLERTLFLRTGFVEHHRLYRRFKNEWKIVFETYEEILYRYKNIKIVTVINSTSPKSSHSSGAKHEQVVISSTKTCRCV